VQQPVAQLTLDYPLLLEDIKSRIRAAQTRAFLSVNRELILLYWEIGQQILESQRREGWGAKVIDRLATDLRSAFPEMAGFSRRNLQCMRSLAEEFPDAQIVQQLVAQIPWGHILQIQQKVKDLTAREFYVRQTIVHGWSRAVLVHQIESRLHRRQGQALNNFDRVLPAPQSDLARETLKDPYIFDYPIPADGGRPDFFLDLLFYHLRLRCYVVVELKVGEFQPEHAGKMSFYLSAVDNLLRHSDDQPTIGLILCKTKSRMVAEYTLQGQQKPIGVASYRTLPARLRDTLPSPKQLEAGLVGLEVN
jgi:predicted nuclease of restriction endonuclease-like (RecB) superfamily